MRVSGIRTCVTGAGLRNWVLVKVMTDRGIWGWGEASVEGREDAVRAALHQLGSSLVGEDPVAVEHHWQRLYRRFWRGGVVLNSALSGLDQALWDIRGKAWQVPVHELLGGAVRRRVRLYTHVGMYDPRRMEAEASAALADGFTAVKTGAWLGDSELREHDWLAALSERVAQLREVVGPKTDVMFDNHGRSRAVTAARLAARLEPYGLSWLEEPTAPEDIEGLARVRAAAPTIPLAAGERLYSKWEVLPLLELRLVDFVQPDLCHAGGITECRKIAATAEAHHVGVAPHNPGGPVSTAASAQLAMAIPNFSILEFVPSPSHPAGMPSEGWTIREGHLHVPGLPGLGVDLDEDALAARPPRVVPSAAAYTEDGTVADV